jgi:FkbM family methyltransferase
VQPYFGWREQRFKARTRFGVTLGVQLPDLIQSYLFFFGIWEPAITEYVRKSLRHGDIFIDVGANIGYFTTLASSLVGEEGRVFAIEASPMIFRKLQENIALNGFKNVQAFNVAAYDKHRDLKFFLGKKANLGASTTFERKAALREFHLEAKIQALPLTDIVGPEIIMNARLVKIDVEGAEWFILSGMRMLLASCSEQTEFLVEISPYAVREQGNDPEDLLNMFDEAGFQAYYIENNYSAEFYLADEISKNVRNLKRPITKITDVLFSKRKLEVTP